MQPHSIHLGPLRVQVLLAKRGSFQALHWDKDALVLSGGGFLDSPLLCFSYLCNNRENSVID